MIATALAWFNAFLSLLLVIFALRYIRKAKGVACWMKLLSILIGMYWCILYAFVALTPPGLYIDSVAFGQIFVRPAFTVTLAVMAGGAIYRWRSYD